MKKFKLPLLSLLLYVAAGLLTIFGLWAFVYCSGYIGEMISMGQLTFSGSEYDIVNFYMSNCAQYIVFAIILAALGRIFHKLQPRAIDAEDNRLDPPVSDEMDENDKKAEGGDLGDWSQNNKVSPEPDGNENGQ